MTRITWGDVDQRPYESGVDRGVLYPPGTEGVPWNGLTSVKVSSVENDVVENYYDGQKYRQLGKPGSFAATLEAFTYPKEFEAFDGFASPVTRSRRTPFGLSYRTMISERDYKIHLVYNALAAPSSRDHESIDTSASSLLYSWEISTSPIPLQGVKASAHLYVDSRYAYPSALSEFEDLLYGNASQGPRMPTPAEVLEFFEARTVLRITEYADGSWSATGPAEMVSMLDATSFQIVSPSAVYLDSTSYTVHSL